MLKSELIELLTNRQTLLDKRDVELCVNCILELMTETLATGGRIEIRGFGNFTKRIRPPRQARNPKTGEAVKLPEKYAIHFKPGKEMRDRVNANREQYAIQE